MISYSHIIVIIKAMPQLVPDTLESMEVCKRLCGTCPSFKSNQLNEFEPCALFCTRGESHKPREEIGDKGCYCLKCELFSEYDLVGGWFCRYGIEGRK